MQAGFSLAGAIAFQSVSLPNLVLRPLIRFRAGFVVGRDSLPVV